MVAHERPHRPRRPRGQWLALALAIAVNLVFLAVLVFSVSWTNRKPEAVTAELYAPPTAPAAQPPPPKVEPPPPKVEPPPAPKPEPKPEPKPPVVEKPDTRAADIAQKAKTEAERKKQEAQKREQEKAAEAKAAEAKRLDEKRQADAREQRLDAMRREAERETQSRQQAEREKQLRDAANREQQDRQRAAAQQATDAAGKRAQAEWVDRIRSKVRSNVIEPPDLPGNPECIFDVTLLPTYEVLDVRLKKSSGNRAYDDAVQRAILKSSPLPRPDRADVFQRALELRVRPRD